MSRASIAVVLAIALPAAAAGPPTPPTLRLPAGVRPLECRVDVTVDPDASTFDGRIDIDVQLDAATPLVWLDGTDLRVSKATAAAGGNDRGATIVDGGEDFVGLSFDPPLPAGKATLRLAYQGKVYEKDWSGLFRQKEGDDWYLYTHFEAIDARRAFPCFDEPSFKVPWQVTLHVPAKDAAFSNTPIAEEKAEDGGRKVVRFARTEPLPSYLVAFAVGPFDVVDAGRAGKNKTPIRIVTAKGKGKEAAYAVEATGPLLALLEDYFGTPYPYAKLDCIAVPQFLGAMENAGLVTFARRLLLATPEEDTVRHHRTYASIAAHELAHQWVGDLVTTAWWDDIWLNEAFASWMTTKVVDRYKPEWKERLSMVEGRTGSMADDTLLSARQIRQPIVTKDDIDNAFDNITYGKGEAVLEMFEAWLGEETFQKGVRSYLARHAGGSATANDFLRAMSEAAGRDVATPFSTFLDQPGVPLIAARLSCGPAGSAAVVSLSQSRYLPVGAQPGAGEPPRWQIPYCIGTHGQGAPSRTCGLLTEASGTATLPASAGCPDVWQPNAGESGYYLVAYEPDQIEKLLRDGTAALSIEERIGLVSELALLCEGGHFPMGRALALVARLANDPERHVVQELARVAAMPRRHLVPPALRPAYARFVRQAFGARAKALGWSARPDDDDETRLLRPTILGLVADEGEDPELQAQARALAAGWLRDRKGVDEDMIGIVLAVAARHGDKALFDDIHAQAAKVTAREERIKLVRALGGFRDPRLCKQALSLLLTDELEPRQATALLWGAAGDEATEPIAYDFVKAHWDELVKRLPRDYGAYLPGVAQGFCGEPERAEVEAFFKDRSTRYTGGPRTLAQTLEAIHLCGAWRAAQSPSVEEFLQRP